MVSTSDAERIDSNIYSMEKTLGPTSPVMVKFERIVLGGNVLGVSTLWGRIRLILG